jgi:hypothetical protein
MRRCRTVTGKVLNYNSTMRANNQTNTNAIATMHQQTRGIMRKPDTLIMILDKKYPNWRYYSIFGSAASAFLFGLFLALCPTTRNRWFGADGAQTVLQFLFTIVVGGAVTFIYQWLEKERERRAAQRTALVDFYRSLLDVHNRIKKVRQELRAHSFKQGQQRLCERRHFEEIMEALEDAQLQTESKASDIKLSTTLFSSEGNELDKKMRGIEEYLNTLLAQYQDNYFDRRENKDDQPIALSETLTDFVAPRRGSRADCKYFTPAEEVQKTLFGLLERYRTPG